MTESTQIVLRSRPVGEPQLTDFAQQTVRLPALSDGEVLLRVVYLSLDPYMRGRMSADKSYAAAQELGSVIVGETVCEVVESRSGLKPGQLVVAASGWQTHSVERAEGLRVIDPSTAPPSTALGVLGMPGFTAYAGLTQIGRPATGETVVVAAATGGVGSAVGQIARIKGARAVGIAGGPTKCAALIDEFGFDAAVDHRSPTFAADLAAAVPDGIDVYFESVGGHVTEAAFTHLNSFARIPLCGTVSAYNRTAPPEGPDRLEAFLRQGVRQSLTMRGFIYTEFWPELHETFTTQMSQWIADDQVRYREDIVAGLDQAPAAFQGLFQGQNFGKLLIEVSELA